MKQNLRLWDCHAFSAANQRHYKPEQSKSSVGIQWVLAVYRYIRHRYRLRITQVIHTDYIYCKRWQIGGEYVGNTWLIGDETSTLHRPLLARISRRPSSGFLPSVFGCASAFSRSVAEGLSKASRTLVEALSKDCRTSPEQQSNNCRSGPGLALGMVVLLFIALGKQGFAQERFSVGGKVISAANGQAIEGATVTNKRTRIHAVTDRAG